MKISGAEDPHKALLSPGRAGDSGVGGRDMWSGIQRITRAGLLPGHCLLQRLGTCLGGAGTRAWDTVSALNILLLLLTIKSKDHKRCEQDKPKRSNFNWN